VQTSAAGWLSRGKNLNVTKKIIEFQRSKTLPVSALFSFLFARRRCGISFPQAPQYKHQQERNSATHGNARTPHAG